MSDLASFTAGAIRDRVVLDLIDENNQLREVIQHYNTLTITGSRGFPVYCRSHLDIDGKYDKVSEMWRVVFHQITCECKLRVRLRDLVEVEIRRPSSVTRLIDLDFSTCKPRNGGYHMVLAAGEGFGWIELHLWIEDLTEEFFCLASGTAFIECLRNVRYSKDAQVSFHSIIMEDPNGK